MMKGRFVGVMIVLFLLASSRSWGEWELKLRGGRKDRSIHLVHFITNEQGWATGGGDTSFWTEDGGETWIRRNLDVSSRASFPNPLDGWQPVSEPHYINVHAPFPPVGTEIWFQRSFDGGLSWTEMAGTITRVVKLNTPPKEVLKFEVNLGGTMFHFLDAQTGFATGSTLFGDKNPFLANYIAKTTDGGQTWTLHLYWGQWRASGFSLRREIQFVDNHNGWALMRGPLAVYRTHDRGQTWEALPYPRSTNPRIDVRYLVFITPEDGWLVLQDAFTVKGALWQTTDGGKTWQPFPETNPLARTSEVLFITPQEGFLIIRGPSSQIADGTFRGILHTIDGGLTWETEFDVSLIEKPPVNARWALTFDPLTQTLWFSGSSETLYKRTPPAELPEGKLPTMWGEMKAE